MDEQKCQGCGTSIPHTTTEEDQRRRILELEAQVKILTERSFESADLITTYEHEVHTLKRQHAAHSRQHSRNTSHPLMQTISIPPTPTTSTTGRPSTPSSHRPSTPREAPQTPTSRLSSFLSMRTRGPPSPPPDPTSQSLLDQERSARIKAEEKLNAVTEELEELSASLFQSANEMVAEERRARARVEERCKVLEEREKRSGERLGGLEKAVERIERVRGVLNRKEEMVG